VRRGSSGLMPDTASTMATLIVIWRIEFGRQISADGRRLSTALWRDTGEGRGAGVEGTVIGNQNFNRRWRRKVESYLEVIG